MAPLMRSLSPPTMKLHSSFTRAPNQYKEYLSEVWYTTKTLDDSKVWISSPIRGVRGDIGGKTGGLDQISNKDATILYCLVNRVKVDYAKIIREDLIHKLNKKTRENIVPYPRFPSFLLKHMMPEYENEELTINPTQIFSVYNLTLKPNKPKEPPFIDHMKAIYNLDVPVDSKALKPSSQNEEVPQGKKLGAKRPPVKKEPTLSSIVIPQLKLILEYLLLRIPYLKNRLEDLSDILKDTRSTFFTPDSPPDEPIIISDGSEEEEEVAKDKDTKATSHDVPKDTSVPPPPSLKLAQIKELMAQVHLLQSQKEDLEQAKAKVTLMKAKPSYSNINQLNELLVTSLKPELSKLLASHDFASCLPTELKELP
ncbi:hypothetical protein Tco_0866538 [Tanacetum coccineum]